MSHFVQLHLLTSYPPANLNRDDTGRPKTAVMGGSQRLRISSQSLKRAWRTSDHFIETLGKEKGERTKEIGQHILQRLLDGGIKEKQAKEWTTSMVEPFGKVAKDGVSLETLVFIAPEEKKATFALADQLIESGKKPEKEELDLLREHPRAVDIAMFGRMLAATPKYNVEAAVQVAHAITTHSVAVEDDFFTAVDDLNSGADNLGAGHMGETEFAAGLFYLYVCIDASLLVENLQGDRKLAGRTIETLVRVATTVSPTGKQNSFASRARALHAVVERGSQQPRSLASAFLAPVNGRDHLAQSITRLTEGIENMDTVYGSCADERKRMNVQPPEGSLDELVKFAGEGAADA